jgi:superfamily I DNA/RNA helicase
MDAVELARQAAARLHAECVAAGHDPRRAYEFAVAAAERRGFVVEATNAGGSMLDGGRATFIAAAAVILHENAGTAFDRAFLVAHEIGHSECGDDEASEPASVDPTRPAEPSPTGLDRVVDYGRRQRREIQMDLFARELLLPRPVARRLHVEEGLTASAIAERFDMPFAVVAQQLLDSLLLPVMTDEVGTAAAARNPNLGQTSAAAHRGSAYLLEAGPGTGKTQTLVMRVARLLADGVDPRRILLLTFSNKAAREMAERIAVHDKKAAAAMWIGTFHAFGLDLVRRFHRELGLPADPRMLDRTEAVEMLEQEFPRLGLVHYRNIYDPTQVIGDILNAISRAKDEVVDDRGYAELADRMKVSATSDDQRMAAEKAAEVARVYGAYEELKRRSNCVDFGDLVSLPVRLLERDTAIRDHFRQKFDHVLVDEYQDVNRSSVRLLLALRGAGENLWVVGDARQSIYRFRGASSFNLRRFATADFPGAGGGRLDQNYRSVPEVVSAFSNFALAMAAGEGNGRLQADRASARHPVEFRTVEQAEAQSVAIAEAVEEMRIAGHRYRDQAVLCSGNEALARLGHDLEQLGVPVLFLGSLFERTEVRDLLSLASLLVDRRAMGLLRVACWDEFAMPLNDVAKVLDHLRNQDLAPFSWLQDGPLRASLTPEGGRALAALSVALDGFVSEVPPWEFFAKFLLDRTRRAAQIAGSTSVLERARGIAIWQFMNFVRAQPTGKGLPIRRLMDRVRRLLRLGDDRDLRQLPNAAQGLDAVRLMTIHGAKGLEFPIVHVPNLNVGTLPRSAGHQPCPPPDGMVAGSSGSGVDTIKAAHDAEQECMFYVALSRARDRLLLYAPTKNAAGSKRGASPFLDRLGAAIARRHVTAGRQLPSAPELAALNLIIDGPMGLSAHQLGLFERCPRRFFYTHILQVGGRQTPTSFTQMHDAVRTIYQAVLGNEPGSEAEVGSRIDDAFAAVGLKGHGYEREYRFFAVSMLDYFGSIRRGQTAEVPAAIRLAIGSEEVLIRPDDVLVHADGRRTLRSIRTGHRKVGAAKDVAAAAFLLAARQAFPDATVELVYLSDEVAETLSMSERELSSRREKLAGFLSEIRAGNFPPESSSRVCPGCPAFFICGPTPAGALHRKFA